MKLSTRELDAQHLDQGTIDIAVATFREQGFVVMEKIYDQSLMNDMLKLCNAVLDRKNKDSAALPYELLHRTPFTTLASHSIVLEMTSKLRETMDLRDDYPRIRRCPPGKSGVAKRVHRDTNDTRKTMLSVDVLLTAFTPENGATQIWPGTQYTRETTEQDYRSVEDRAASTPFQFVAGPAGSVSFRDGRAWHRAGINLTEDARLMLSIG